MSSARFRLVRFMSVAVAGGFVVGVGAHLQSKHQLFVSAKPAIPGEAVKTLLRDLYSEVAFSSTSDFRMNGFYESEDEEEKMSKFDTTYGVFEYEGVRKIMEIVSLKPNDVVADFGSGVGNVILQLLLESPVQKLVGIEIVPSRHRRAVTAFHHAAESPLCSPVIQSPKFSTSSASLSGVKTVVDKLIVGDPNTPREVLLVNGDIMSFDVSDVSVVITNSLTFPDPLLRYMSTLKQRCPNLRYIVTTRRLPNLRIDQRVAVKCSWNEEAQLYVYRFEPNVREMIEQGVMLFLSTWVTGRK